MTRSILCNSCYKKLNKTELLAYSLQWQFSGDMYCMKCRECPDDCRYTPCKLVPYTGLIEVNRETTMWLKHHKNLVEEEFMYNGN